MKDYKPNINALVNAARLDGIRLGLEAAEKIVWKDSRWMGSDGPSIGDRLCRTLRALDPETIAREGWTPPEPVVDPDILAFREWAKATKLERPFVQESTIDAGGYDHVEQARAYLAGARMAREQERERAKVLEEYVEAYALRFGGVARSTLAKYHGEA